MKTKSLLCLLTAFMLPMMACGLLQPGYTATQTAVAQTTVAASWTDTPTPDPCLPENLSDAVSEVHDFMIKFDKLSTEAAQAQREDLPEKITELEDLLQAAQEQKVAPCLQTLKDHQLKHMKLVIDTLNAFADGVDQKIINEMVQQARDEHDAYALELARLLEIDITTNTPTP